MFTIEVIRGREILDSRGNPTVEVESRPVGRRNRKSCCSFRSINRSFRSGRAA